MITEAQIQEYLKDNDYVDVFIFLILSADNLRNRGLLLKGSISGMEDKLKRLLEKIEENPDVDPRNREVSTNVKDVHYAELEVIQRLNILIELLAVYYRIIRTNLRELPKAIGKGDISARQLYSEFAYFKDQTLNDVWSNFKYPDVHGFSELSPEEQKTLKNLLDKSVKQIHSLFCKIFEFQKRFRPVYNKCKHTLSELTGIYGINKERHACIISASKG